MDDETKDRASGDPSARVVNRLLAWRDQAALAGRTERAEALLLAWHAYDQEPKSR